MKLRLFFLKYILNQESDSLVYKFLQLQIQKPVKFDWASTCLLDLKKLKISISFEDIKEMPKNKFKKIIREKCQELGFEYLSKKRGSKGREIDYKKIEIAEYLLPNDEIDIDEQRTIFAIRNKITRNFPT